MDVFGLHAKHRVRRKANTTDHLKHTYAAVKYSNMVCCLLSFLRDRETGQTKGKMGVYNWREKQFEGYFLSAQLPKHTAGAAVELFRSNHMHFLDIVKYSEKSRPESS